MPYKKLLLKITTKENLSFEESIYIANEMLQGNFNTSQICAFLIGLKMKGESVDEIAGFSKALRNNATEITLDSHTFDTCGTGGDGSNSFNISTTSAFVLAGAGVKVAKHGNRSISSNCGSADVLSELGIDINSAVITIKKQLQTIGMSFLFAPSVHPLMKNIMPARKTLGLPTIFNIIGPLSNPVNLYGQVIGVYDETLVPKVSAALLKLGIKSAAVIHGHGHVDELSMSGPNLIHIIKNGALSQHYINATDYGFKPSKLSDIKGGNSYENSITLKNILSGTQQGPKLDVTLFNAGFSLYIAGVANSIDEGISVATDSIKKGRALKVLNDLITFKL